MADSPEQARVRAMLRARGEQLAPRVGPETDYVLVQPKGSSNGSTSNGSPAGGGTGRWGQVKGWAERIQQAPMVSTPNRVPRFLGARPILFGAWGVAMGAIMADEWFNNGILPRPSRLWQATLLYGMLALLSISAAMVPLANALAIGFTIVILWELFGGRFGTDVESA